MTRAIAVFTVLCAAIYAPPSAAAQAPCTCADLQAAVDSYRAAQATGSTDGLQLASTAKYVENLQEMPIGEGILQTPLAIAFHRSLLDVDACQTFTEAIVTGGAHPYVLGVRVKLAGGRLSEVETIVTDEGDWLFNAGVYLKFSTSEDWDVIPVGERDTRQTLVAAANAYEDRFSDPAVAVPFGMPCNRLEGGIHSGNGTTEDTCAGGFPGADFPITNRRFVVDPDIGAVVVLSRFSANELPDSHLFRVEHGKIRYVHTLTVCTIPGCGFTAAPAPQQ